MSQQRPARILSKSTLSMYFRTQCDRELYLSLFKDSKEIFRTNDIPIPLKSRPGVQLITQSGREFERDQYDKLIQAIPNNVIHTANGSTSTNTLEALSKASDLSFILQPEIKPEEFRSIALTHLGLTIEEQRLVPKIAGLKPDALYVYKPELGDYEILPDGSRCQIAANDSRLAISVIDLKNVTEGNPSYAAEVCLYAFFFANWLATEGAFFRDKYFVSDKVYLWKHVEMPNFTRTINLVSGVSAQKRIEALLLDLEDGLIDYSIFIPSVRKFFKEDIIRVITKGDMEGWQAVSYYVNPRCSACDWLGNPDWLVGEDKDNYTSKPYHYCFYSADNSDHLSKMAGLSKGASQILTNDGHLKVADLAGMANTAAVLKKHALLKRSRSQIGHKATALGTGIHTVDNQIKIGGLARNFKAEYDIIVNFDAGSSLLTGIAIRGIVFAPFGEVFSQRDGSTSALWVLQEEYFVTEKENTLAEWVTLLNFITKLSNWISQVEAAFKDKGWGNVQTQVCFWESVQYEELCNAFSRHLPKILGLTDKVQRALAWIFPAEELMEREEQLAPSIVFIRDIVDTSLRLPVKFANTLLGVAQYYHFDSMPPRKVDKYYREPLGNAIPRERIFEIWKSTTGTVMMYGSPASVSDAVKKYGEVLKAHTWALGSITAQLRSDLKNCLEGNAPTLSLTDFRGAQSVAYDSKLWIQWDKVSTATAQTEAKANLIASAERLEASYQAIILTRLINDLGNLTYEFEVSEESTESKLEEGGSFYVLGIVQNPGFPLQTGKTFGVAVEDPADISKTYMPMYNVIAVTLQSLDRVNRIAKIQLRAKSKYVEPVFNALFDDGFIYIGDYPIYLLEGMPPNFSGISEKILKEVKNPTCSKIAPETLNAMGTSAARRIPRGIDAVTPIARVLWEADTLSTFSIRTNSEVESIVSFVESANKRPLNPSQLATVAACAKNQLSVIWGPPGTGKTDTLAAFLHAIVFESQTNTKTRKILITGPNYRAIEEIAGRLLKILDNDDSCQADMFLVYSSSRDPKVLSETNPHFKPKSINLNLESPSEDAIAFRDSLTDTNRVTIVATTAHIIHNITKFVYGEATNFVKPLFDLVVIDESSQVEVTLALRPLSVLKPQGQVVIAGDHLQMPPISSLEPPQDAEYLVGSIQSYLIKRFSLTMQQLLINYRSNQHLVDYARTLGYPPQLTAFNKIQSIKEINDLNTVVAGIPASLPLTQAYKELLAPERVVTTLIHEDIVSSQANEVEAKLVAGLAYCLRYSMAKELNIEDSITEFSSFTDDELFEYGLGIVTPHKAQKALVIKELKAIFPNVDPLKIFEAVDTVERFQGGQRQTIIVSFGVGDVDIIAGEEAFLLQLERTNVAVSRAQAKCIVLMPKALAYYLPSDQKTLKTAKAIKTYIEEFCINRVSIDIDMAGIIRTAEVRWH